VWFASRLEGEEVCLLAPSFRLRGEVSDSGRRALPDLLAADVHGAFAEWNMQVRGSLRVTTKLSRPLQLDTGHLSFGCAGLGDCRLQHGRGREAGTDRQCGRHRAGAAAREPRN
jgi:hypothetical protein